MCLAVPGKITERQEFVAQVDVNGVGRQVSLMLLPDVLVGDYVLVHAGFAIQKIDEQEARETMALFQEIAANEE